MDCLALDKMEMEKIKIVPGVIFEPVGNTFIAGYFDLNLDLRSTEKIYTNLYTIKNEIMKLQGAILHMERNIRAVPRDELIRKGSRSLPVTPAPIKTTTTSKPINWNFKHFKQNKKPIKKEQIEMMKKQSHVMLAEVENLTKNPWILSFNLKKIRKRGLVDEIGKIF